MFIHSQHKPHHPKQDVPEAFEPGQLPVEPDQGPVPGVIPDETEDDGAVAPEA